MSSRPLTWLLLAALVIALPGCCMVGIGCCAIEIDLELSNDDTDDWRQSRVTMVTVLLANSERDWVGPFESRSELARWIADRGLSSDERTHKESLIAQGRLQEHELDISQPRGVVQLAAALDPGKVEPFQGRLLVFANYRADDPEGFVIEIPYTEACRYGVRLHASGELEDVSDEAALR